MRRGRALICRPLHFKRMKLPEATTRRGGNRKLCAAALTAFEISVVQRQGSDF